VKADRLNFFTEGVQQFLRQPSGAEHPIALTAVIDVNFRFCHTFPLKQQF
jgi:hypothetical protein